MPIHNKPKRLIIIGAGLSGLYAAYLLQNHFEIVILEARDRIGGRILGTPDGGDLGPTWVWSHHKATLELSHELGLTLFPQFTNGYALYDGVGGIERFNAPPSIPSARFSDGISSLTDALYRKLHTVKFHFNTPVKNLIDSGNEIMLQSSQASFHAEIVISTLPPRLVADLSFTPALSPLILSQLNRTPTWMGNSAKALITYDHAFWREDGLSGFAISHHGALAEIHDASQPNQPALFGFFHTQQCVDNAHSVIIDQLTRLFGLKASHPLRIDLKDWKKDPYSSSVLDQKGLSEHPHYGLNISAFDEKFHCIGTETSFIEGGYLEGALQSASKLARQLLQ